MLAWVMLRGSMAFRNETEARAYASNKNLPEMLIKAVPSGASPECLQFLTECLKFNPDERPDAAELRTRDWLKDVPLPQARARAPSVCLRMG